MLVFGGIGNRAGLSRISPQCSHEDLECRDFVEQRRDVIEHDRMLRMLFQEAPESHRTHSAVVKNPRGP